MEDIKYGESLIVDRKIVSIAVASLIMLGALIFMAGYFWGYRQASQDVQLNIKQTSFADQISFASNQLDAASNVINIKAADDSNSLVEPIDQAIKPIQSNPDLLSNQIDNVIETEIATDATNYYAELIGFGRLKAAQAFVDKMKAKGLPVIIRKRASKTGTGKIVNWYQVITESYTSKEDLQKIVDAIKQTEHLQGIKIRSL